MLITNQLKNLIRVCKVLIVAPASLVVLLAWTATDELVTQLRVDYEAFKAAEDDFRSQREYHGLDGSEAADYASYVAGLQRRVFEDCLAVVRSGSPFPKDLPCPVIVPPTTQSADIATQEEQTAGEQVATLDSMLNAGLGEYDERLLREQERIKASAPNNNSENGGSGGSGSDGSDGEGSDAEGSEAAGNSQGSGEASSDENQAASSGGQPASGPGGSGTGPGSPGKDIDQPADIPDGSDDDIVARQLREAAEKETDPELKAKLWEEYRKYKQGTQ